MRLKFPTLFVPNFELYNLHLFLLICFSLNFPTLSVSQGSNSVRVSRFQLCSCLQLPTLFLVSDLVVHLGDQLGPALLPHPALHRDVPGEAVLATQGAKIWIVWHPCF